LALKFRTVAEKTAQNVSRLLLFGTVCIVDTSVYAGNI